MQDFNVRPIYLKTVEELHQVADALHISRAGQAIMAGKAFFCILQVDHVKPIAANILKQELLARGGEAMVHELVIVHGIEESSCLLCGTEQQLLSLAIKLKGQQFGLPALAVQIEEALANIRRKKVWQIPCGKKQLVLGKKTLIMGILNVTPDSFSDGGTHDCLPQAVAHARKMIAEGVDIIDVGGESTRPGYVQVSAQEEKARVLPVIQALRRETSLPISIDTYKAEVADAALLAGADIMNDIWGLQKDPQMALVAARHHCPVIVMHNQEGTSYTDIMGDMLAFFRRSKEIALQAGMTEEQIIYDPGIGIGFGKNTEQNLQVLRRLNELAVLGRPVLVGTSRKRFIGDTTKQPVEEREWGTAASVVWSIAQGAQVIRVHSVQEMKQAVAVADAIRGEWNG